MCEGQSSVSLRSEMYPVAGGQNSILVGFQTPVLAASNTAYPLPSVITYLFTYSMEQSSS